MPTRTRYAIASVTATLINSTASPIMMPNVIPTTFNASGRTTAKTNTPRRIIPMILKIFLASFIVCSPFTFASPKCFGLSLAANYTQILTIAFQ